MGGVCKKKKKKTSEIGEKRAPDERMRAAVTFVLTLLVAYNSGSALNILRLSHGLPQSRIACRCVALLRNYEISPTQWSSEGPIEVL